jgi:hypothetical protein
MTAMRGGAGPAIGRRAQSKAGPAIGRRAQSKDTGGAA